MRVKRLLGHGLLAVATTLTPSTATAAQKHPALKPAKEGKPASTKYTKPSPKDWPDLSKADVNRSAVLQMLQQRYDKLRRKECKGTDLILRISLRGKLTQDPRWLSLMTRPTLTSAERQELGLRDTIHNLTAIGGLNVGLVKADAESLHTAKEALSALTAPKKEENKKEPAARVAKQ